MTLEQAQVAELRARATLWTMLAFWTLIPLLAVLGAIIVLVGWGISVVT